MSEIYRPGEGLFEDQMKREQILDQINKIMCDLTEDDSLVVEEHTKAEDVDWWDSLLNLNLVLALEAKFKIRFEVKEINTPSTIGRLAEMIENKTN